MKLDNFSVLAVDSIFDGDVELVYRDMEHLSGCRVIKDLENEALLLEKFNKKQLANYFSRMLSAVLKCEELMKTGCKQVDQMRCDQIKLQKQVIGHQNELLTCKTEQLNSVQTTVKNELRSYSQCLQQNLPTPAPAITPEQVKKAVRNAVEEDDRSKNVMLFGVEEDQSENLEQTVSEICQQLNEKPQVTIVSRIGIAKPGTTRPIKVSLRSTDIVSQILSKAKQLKSTERYKHVYLSVDRTPEEREARKQLLEQVKELRVSHPDQYHFIRNNEICSRSK